MTDAVNRDQSPLATATAFHDETPDFLKVLESGNAVVLAKYLHDRSTFELDLLAANGKTVAELADRISRYRKQSGPSDPRDVVVLDPAVPEGEPDMEAIEREHAYQQEQRRLDEPEENL